MPAPERLLCERRGVELAAAEDQCRVLVAVNDRTEEERKRQVRERCWQQKIMSSMGRMRSERQEREETVVVDCGITLNVRGRGMEALVVVP